MRGIGMALFAAMMLQGCSRASEKLLFEGMWLAHLDVLDEERLPFNFKVIRGDEGNYLMEIYNAEEVITVDEIEFNNDSITIKLPVFEGYISGTFSKKEIEGVFIKESVGREVPFSAVYGIKERFSTEKPPKVDVSGNWQASFSPNTMNTYPGKGIFKQEGARVTGTFRTTTGDYRFLEGVVRGDSLKLSAFDGSHAFLITAKISDSSLVGTFYSGNHFKEPFIAERDNLFDLPHVDSLTYLKKGSERLSFAFPDSEGRVISLDDKQFQGKVVIVQLMGTWCPNCLDETKFLVNFFNQTKSPDLKIVGLAFETAKTEEIAFHSINRLKERIGVPYPLLLAQFGTSNKAKAQEKLPMLDHVLSYPTTLFVDKTGKVRKIHTGFNGPATGESYETFKKEFTEFVSLLLAE